MLKERENRHWLVEEARQIGRNKWLDATTQPCEIIRSEACFLDKRRWWDGLAAAVGRAYSTSVRGAHHACCALAADAARKETGEVS